MEGAALSRRQQKMELGTTAAGGVAEATRGRAEAGVTEVAKCGEAEIR